MANYMKVVNMEDVVGSNLFLPNIAKQKEEADEQLSQGFQQLMENKQLFKVKISAVGTDGSLRVALSDGITGIIPSGEISSKKKMTKNDLEKYNNREIAVIITHTEENGKVIYLSILQAKEIARQHYLKVLKRGDTVNAIVVHYNPEMHRILLDIEGCGLYGYVPLRDWGYRYFYKPQEQIRTGTIERVRIEKFYEDIEVNNKQRKAHFRCSKKALLPNPWIGIEKAFPVGTELVVTATMLTKDHNFFASTPMLSELEILCDYPNNSYSAPTQNATLEDIMSEEVKPRTIIHLGEDYLIRINKVSEADQILTGKVIKHIPRKKMFDKVSPKIDTGKQQENNG